MVKVFVFAENPGQLPELAALVKKLGAEAVAALTAGSPEEARAHAGPTLGKVYVATGLVEPGQLAALAEKLLEQHPADIVATVSTKNNVTAAAILAARKKMVMLTEAMDPRIVDGVVVAKRRVLGGRAEAGYKAAPPVVLALARGSLEPLQEQGAVVEELEAPQPRVTRKAVEEKKREAVNIETAEIVVGVGRGFKRKEDLKLAEELAQLLGGVVGASRPIVADYGWLSEDRWIGISGKKIRPKAYIAIGISGAPQHMAATLDSKIIVAINKDKNAPIFQYADYGIVADLYQFLPVLIKKLKERLGRA